MRVRVCGIHKVCKHLREALVENTADEEFIGT